MNPFLEFVIQQDATLNEKLWDALKCSVTALLKSRDFSTSKVTVKVVIEKIAPIV